MNVAPAPLRLRLKDALVTAGGSITRPDLVGYLAALFGVPRVHAADVLLEEAAAGEIVITSGPDCQTVTDAALVDEVAV